jgi:hypothetical protein
MYDFLTVLNEESFIRLTQTQQAVLVSIFVAQTPELAYEVATGDTRITTSRDFLIRHGLIEVGNGQLRVTSSGSDMLESCGLMDATGEVTERGTELVAKLEQHKREFNESLIPYRTLKSL